MLLQARQRHHAETEAAIALLAEVLDDDLGLLESALARPQNAFAYGEDDIVVLAVRLMAGIAQAHAFEQGNKRTAFEALWHFLRLNGFDLAIDDTEAWAAAVIDLLEHRLTEEDFAHALRPYVTER